MANNQGVIFLAVIVGLIIIFSLGGKLALLPSGEYRSNTGCTFITNVVSGSTYKNSDGWISVNAFGTMKGYGENGYSSFKCTDSGATLLSVTTIEGNSICTRS